MPEDKQDQDASRNRPGTGLSVADLRAWPLVDKYVWTRDDRGLGDDFRTVVHPRDGECELIAKALYGHGILVLSNNTYEDEGWASKAEKAFWAGCTDGNLGD